MASKAILWVILNLIANVYSDLLVLKKVLFDKFYKWKKGWSGKQKT